MVSPALLLLSAIPISLIQEQGAAPQQYASIRIGAGSSSTRPELCGELSFAMFSVEGCGSGSGTLLFEPTREISHYRLKATLMSWQTPVGFLQPRVAAGFAELQIGEDAPGFFFASAGPLGTETAGPEAGLSLRCLTPIVAGFELVTELTFNTAFFAHAPELNRQMTVVQPSVSLGLGVGF